jgi:type I restriction enzyme, S subunit
MSLAQYARYRQSGADWLGSIPEHWSAVRIKTIFEIRKRIAGGLGHDVLSVTQRGLKIRDTDSNDGQLSMDYSKYQLVEPNDFVMNHMDLLTGYVDVSKFRGVTSPDYRVFTAREKKLSLRFFLYLFQHGYQQRIFYAFGQGASGLGRWRMPTDSFNDFILPVPPLSEQTAIATFLDRETVKIDALVEEQRRLIELLREKRKAVISHAVTKGIDPNVPMKDSGVEWLGEVPKHWKVVALKRIAAVQTGIAKGKDVSGIKTIEVPYLRVANVQDGYIDLSEVATIDIPIELLDRYRLRPGDVLMNEGGDFDKLGRGHIWDGQIDPCIHQNHVFAVRPHSMPSSWLSLVTSSDYAQFYFMGRSKQSTNLASISSTNLMELPVTVPPEREQAQTVHFVYQQVARLDELTREAQSAIILFNERRAALISAAVTGKIEVRRLVEADAPIPDVVAA